MTKKEVEVLRLRVRILALETLVRALCTSVARTLPSAYQPIVARIQELQKTYSQIALKNVAPEYSDLVAGEYQEALDDVLKSAEAYFGQR